MKQKFEKFVVLDNQHPIIVYANGLGFSVFLPGVPQSLKKKASGMIQSFLEEQEREIMEGQEIAAELCITTDIYMENCQYEISAYIYSEDQEMEIITCEIYPGTEDYEALKAYALQQVNQYLFAK